MSPVKYQRFLPAVTITASIALLGGCIFAATSGASGFSEKPQASISSTVSNASPEAFMAALSAMKPGKAEKLYEVSSHDKSVAVSVFGNDDEDRARTARFAETVTRHQNAIEEARISEYDSQANVKQYEGSMFLKVKDTASSEEVINAIRDFTGFNTNTSLSLGNPKVQFLSATEEALTQLLPASEEISAKLKDRTKTDAFSILVHTADKEIAIIRHSSGQTVSAEQFKNEAQVLQTEVKVPSDWKIIVQ